MSLSLQDDMGDQLAHAQAAHQELEETEWVQFESNLPPRAREGDEYLVAPTTEDAKGARDDAALGMSESTVGIHPAEETPSTTTTTRAMDTSLTTALSNAYSPMSDVNVSLQSIAPHGEGADSGQGYQYKDASQLPTRRQNVACDACRARKVKCVRKSMNETVSTGVRRAWTGADEWKQCDHCRSKATPCT